MPDSPSLPCYVHYDIFWLMEIEPVASGGITSPQGFCAGATYAGIKQKGKDCLDLGILFSEEPCAAAAVFTKNKVKAAPVVLCRERLKNGRVRALVVNSGCANACTGEAGLDDAAETARLTSQAIGVEPEDVLVASTGVIGEQLPMQRIKEGINQVILSRDGGHELARAIMTTDTVSKETAVTVKADKAQFTIGGIAKGSGMIHPDMATLLCFLTTDADVEPDFLKSALRKAADISFNMISVDGDTSTNDMVLIMANGTAGNKAVTKDDPLAEVFQRALDQTCLYLAKCIARDGEGATKLIEVTVGGAFSLAEARQAARTIVGSPLVKTAIHGNDPNWGRIMAAVGRSGAEMAESRTDLTIGGIEVLKNGSQTPIDREKLVKKISNGEVRIHLNLNQGTAAATAWGCDLSEEYVTINSEYTT